MLSGLEAKGATIGAAAAEREAATIAARARDVLPGVAVAVIAGGVVLSAGSCAALCRRCAAALDREPGAMSASAEGALHGALMAALDGAAGLDALNGIYAGPPVKATAPYVELGALISIDWSTKDAAGRELRPAVTVRDAGETPARVHDLAGAVGAAIEACPRDLGGWRIASLVFVRTRVVRDGPGKWAATVEYRVRMLAG